MLKAINIISFDVPFPANYGGVIDVFYKIKYFHSKGIKVHLHCFEYGRGEQKELNKYCASVYYYKRKTGINTLISSIPYIVKSRVSEELKTNLLKNDYPILFEGLHTCFLLNDKAFKPRLKIVRNHNIEHDYYSLLAKIEKDVLKRQYFKVEAKRLKKYEVIIENADFCLTVSSSDLSYFKNKYSNTKFIHVPCFHPNKAVNIQQEKGNYVLYHGNLSVVENNNAAEFIITTIFNTIDIPLKIAGLNPSSNLIQLVNKYNHVSLVQNPDDNEMNQLIANAQINFLYTNQATGLKLKLLNVLYNGKHCIVNSKMVTGTSLKDVCLVQDDIQKLKKHIETIFFTEISKQEIEKREIILQRDYANENSFQKIINSF